MSTQESEVKIDCSKVTSPEVCEMLRKAEAGSTVVLDGLSEKTPGVGAGLDLDATVKIVGSLGDFSAMLGSETNWEVSGDVGHSCAHSQISSRMFVSGSAGDYLAAYATGGFISILGAAGDACGYAMAGADIVVRSRVGDSAGACMRDGDLVLANGAGKNLGLGMTGGSIYLRGDADSVADGVRKMRMKDADSMRLSLLLARAGIKGDVKEFALYRQRSK